MTATGPALLLVSPALGVKTAKDLMITRVLNQLDVHNRLSGLGAEPAPSTPQAFDKFIADDIATLTRIARAANIRAN